MESTQTGGLPVLEEAFPVVSLYLSIIYLLLSFTYYFVSSLDNKLTSHGPLTGSSTQQWVQFSTIVKEAAQSTPGLNKRVHQDWFDENDEAITQLLNEKQKAFMAWQNDISFSSKQDHFKPLFC
ncbi:hypothetical protein ACOMHN_035754 [Nucella lapillus]